MKNMRITLRLEIKQSHSATVVRSTSAAVEEEMLDRMLPEIEASFKKWLALQIKFLGGKLGTSAEEDSSADKDTEVAIS